MSVLIPLSQGFITIIDDEDYQKIFGLKWWIKNGYNTKYACTRIVVGGTHMRFRMHRLLLNAPVGMEVDHINGDGLDNRRHNLRLATSLQNAGNKRYKKVSSTGLRGVYPKRGNAFYARIGSHHIGTFSTKEDAARAYDQAAKERYGEFARPNFPEAA